LKYRQIITRHKWSGLENFKNVIQGMSAWSGGLPPSGDAVLGARGSKLQLVLNGLFHQEASTSNITAEDYQQVKALPMVDRAIPIVVGDNVRGVRLVGVSDDFFQNLECAPDHVYTVEPGGRPFRVGQKEAMVGSLAAHQMGWTIGTPRPAKEIEWLVLQYD
jgi:hypothetical protein